jgi:3-hydroxyacyl-CoA dehydrogenase
MGAGIAAHAANAGLEVALHDLTRAQADQGLSRAIGAGALMDASLAAHIVTASTDDLDSVASADWIVEAVAERLEVKHTLYERLESVVRADAVISSNTSTIALRRLVQGRSADFRSRFLITHFFNPPRRMRLLEIVAGAEVAPDVVRCFSEFAQRGLGKCVVQAHDTPGFIANRIGVYWMSVGLHEAIRMGIAPELADACLAHPFGIPSTGVLVFLISWASMSCTRYCCHWQMRCHRRMLCNATALCRQQCSR